MVGYKIRAKVISWMLLLSSLVFAFISCFIMAYAFFLPQYVMSSMSQSLFFGAVILSIFLLITQIGIIEVGKYRVRNEMSFDKGSKFKFGGRVQKATKEHVHTNHHE